MKSIAMIFGLSLCTTLLAFTFGGDSYTIHLGKNQVAQYYVLSKKPLPALELTGSDTNSTLSIFYSECGNIGKERVLTLRNSKNEVLKKWTFPNAMSKHAAMTVNTYQIAQLMESDKVFLYYSSKEVKSSQVLASIATSVANSAKKN